jgi:uncharacterized protein YcaQ
MGNLAKKESLSISEARRIALAAQQFVPAAKAPRNAGGFVELVRRLGVVQMDSVNVLVRSHYLPVFSRRGAYSHDLLERAAYPENSSRGLIEYWGHEASLLPMESWPLFRWRMQDALNGEGTWKRLRRYAQEHRAQVASALNQIRERGALGASELTDGGRSKGSWWGWSEGQGNPRVVVLDRRGDDRPTPQFRALVRPHRANHPHRCARADRVS